MCNTLAPVSVDCMPLSSLYCRLKINDVVQCKCTFHKSSIDNCWSWRRSICVINRAAVVAAVHTISQAWHGDASQMMMQKCSKLQSIFEVENGAFITWQNLFSQFSQTEAYTEIWASSNLRFRELMLQDGLTAEDLKVYSGQKNELAKTIFAV